MKKEVLRIVGTNNFMRLANSEPTADVVVFEDIGDVHPFKGLRFPNAHIVQIINCNKNFTCYWLTPFCFPNVKEIYLVSHPCDYEVCRRFKGVAFFLLESYKHYVEGTNVKLITQRDVPTWWNLIST